MANGPIRCGCEFMPDNLSIVIFAGGKTWMAGSSPRLSGTFFAVQDARH
jgi:hypothetical protein